MAEGEYLVNVEVVNNEESYGVTNIIIQVGGDLLVNEISSTYSGKHLLRVGSGLFDVEPGQAAIEVDTAPNARWELLFTKVK